MSQTPRPIIRAFVRIKRWRAEDNAVLEEALRTGYLPDGRIATQQRLADHLGFCRLTVVNKLDGRQLPRAREINAEAGRRGGLECYRRRLARVEMG